MLIDRNVAQAALEALESCVGSRYGRHWNWPESAFPSAMAHATEARDALRAALAEEPQEPAPMTIEDLNSTDYWRGYAAGVKAPHTEAAQPEPVAWISEYGKDGYAGAARRVFLEDPSTMYPNSRITPLYASPPAQPEPLTAEQVRDLAKSAGLDWQRGYVVDDFSNRYDEFARAIERAIRETTT